MNRRLIEKVNYRLSKEIGTIFKDPGGKINICLVYPNTYSVGMSNLGFQGIYSMLNNREDVVCERSFLPEEIEEYKRTNTPLFSYESKRPLKEFDIIAFSISFENDYPNILKILDLSNIALSLIERNKYDPLLIAGGVCAFFNPEPISLLFDIIFIGEAEESLAEFLNIYKKSKNKKDIKKNVLSLDGLYIPEFYEVIYNEDGTIKQRITKEGAKEKIQRRIFKDLSISPIKTSIITPEMEFSNMYLIEAMRGCPWKCRFCLVGHIYNPVRKKDPSVVKKEIEKAKELRGEFSEKKIKIGLVGPSLTDYEPVKDVLCIEDVDFSITSLRASKKSFQLVELLKGHKSVSIAPEVGTERMRKIINKKITEEDIISTSSLILNSGIENLRLYFMIGLPNETEEDILGIVELSKKIRKTSKKGKIVLSISTFVPKPFTPFQWHSMDSLSSLKNKLEIIKKSLKEESNIRIFHDVPKYAHMQGLFSLGDRRIFYVLREMIDDQDFKKACTSAGINMDFFIFREKGFSEIFPWDFIDIGISKEQLWKEYQEALIIN
jgi:radical SAM superfamily enzyme YgiQ (UPF0313 family)